MLNTAKRSKFTNDWSRDLFVYLNYVYLRLPILLIRFAIDTSKKYNKPVKFRSNKSQDKSKVALTINISRKEELKLGLPMAI